MNITPKVNGSMLPRFVGSRISIVGRIINPGTGMIQVESSDRQQIRISSQSPIIYSLTPGFVCFYSALLFFLLLPNFIFLWFNFFSFNYCRQIVEFIGTVNGDLSVTCDDDPSSIVTYSQNFRKLIIFINFFLL